ncbi:MAG: AAA family ATPase [Burkholderiales bacterium]|nr:AAA family ATPase [Burkholderiales bacterium]
MKVFAVANQKGGVGKTSVAVNLSATLAHYGQSVLLVDLDPQGNATTGSGVDKNGVENTVYGVLLGEYAVANARIRTESGFDVLPANRELAGAEIELINIERREFRLKDALAHVDSDYAFVVIDCPPALNMLTVNALTAANAVIIPMQCEYYALEGLSDLVGTLRKVKANLNPSIEIEALVRTMYDPRSSLTTQVSDEIKSHFGDKVFDTVIPRNIRIAEAPSYGKPVILHDAASKGAAAHFAFARELLAREGIAIKEKV